MTAPTQPPPADTANTKRNALLNLLDHGEVDIHLDPRRPGTLVPLRYQRDKSLTLKLGYSLAKMIPDLDVAEDGIGCTLTFNCRPEYVFMPWSSVFGMQSRIGSIIWPDDVPPDARAAAAPPVPPVATGTAEVIDLMARRSPKDRRACERRLKLTAPAAIEPDGVA